MDLRNTIPPSANFSEDMCVSSWDLISSSGLYTLTWDSEVFFLSLNINVEMLITQECIAVPLELYYLKIIYCLGVIKRIYTQREKISSI